MNLLTAYLNLPLFLAQADTPPPDVTPSGTPPDFNQLSNQLSPEQMQQAKSFGLVGGVVGLVVAVIFVAALWKIYTKAGKPGWASIIPIYNWVVLLEIAGRPIWWIVLFLIPFVNFVVILIVVYDLCKSFGYGVGFFIGMLLLSPIFILILGFGSARYVGPGGRPLAYAGGYPPAAM